MNDNVQALEQVRQATIAFLQDNQPVNWQMHVEELTRGKPMLTDGVYRIGRWTFDFATGTLLREADITPEVRRYGMSLVHDDTGWRVRADFWEREQWDFGR
jgi:hypothetical protein